MICRPFTIAVALLLTVGSARPDTNSSLQPYPIDWAHAALSAVDLSRFLEAPAGRDGFLRVEGSHIFKPDGSRFRFWGVNLCGPDCFPSHDEAEALAADLARLGINVVRFHHLDSNWGRSIFDSSRDDTRALSAENLERLDYLINQLRRWGIYANLNLNVLRVYKAGDGVRDWKLLGVGKGATYFNSRLLELQHEYARQLLTHTNAYTGNAYAQEPAVAVVEMVNENSLLEAWVGWRLDGRDDRAGDTWSPIPVSYAEELTDLYNTWLGQRLSQKDLDMLRTESMAGPGGRIPRLKPDEFGKASRERFHAEARFYMETEQAFFIGMKRLLRDELGVRSMLVGTADHNDGYSAFGHIQANLVFDIVDGHGYWEHPNLGKETWIKNTPMVNDPLDSTVVQFARTPVAGRPFTISEVNHPFPHEYACEGWPILTAYALFHDWDGIYWFTWGLGRRGNPDNGIQKNGWFDISNDPAKVAHLATCGLLWHRRDIRAARTTVTRSYGPDALIETLRADRGKARPFFQPDFPRSLPLQHATRFTFDSGPAKAWPRPASLGLIESDTRELRWVGADRKQGLVVMDTDQAQGLIGHVRGQRQTTRNLAADVTNEFCSILLTSLDDLPVRKSRRLLVTATDRVTNTGFRWKEDHQTVAEWGKGPVLLQPVTGSITLRDLGLIKALRVFPLESSGRPLDTTLPVTRTGSGYSFTLGDPATVWYAVEIERPQPQPPPRVAPSGTTGSSGSRPRAASSPARPGRH